MSQTSPTKPTIVERLLSKYSPPLDPALVLVIASDHLGSQEAESEASRTLDALLPDAKLHSVSMSGNPGMNMYADTAPGSSAPDDRPPMHSDSICADPTSASAGPGPTEEDCITTTDSTGDSAPTILDQLQSLFPDQTVALLEAAISNASDPEDLQEVANLVLGAQDSSGPTVEPSPTSPQMRKKGKRGLQTFHLTDVMRGDSRARIHEAEAYERSQPVINAWATIESQAMHLATLLCVEPAKVKSAYYARNCNLVLALEDMLRELEVQRRARLSGEHVEQMDTQLAFLQAIGLEQEDDVLRRLLVVTGFDAGVVFDLLQFIEDLTKRQGTVQFNFFHNLPSDRAPSNSRARLSAPPGGADWSAVRKQAAADAGPARSHSLMECHTRISSLKTERNAKLAKATAAYQAARSGPATNRLARGAVPMVYAQDAQQLTGEIKRWEFMAAQLCVGNRQRIAGDSHSIDLHGLTRSQAVEVTRDALQTWWASNASPRQAFRIITGAGTHSRNSTPVLLPAITTFLEQNGFEYRFEDRGNGKAGAVFVNGRGRS